MADRVFVGSSISVDTVHNATLNSIAMAMWATHSNILLKSSKLLLV